MTATRAFSSCLPNEGRNFVARHSEVGLTSKLDRSRVLNEQFSYPATDYSDTESMGRVLSDWSWMTQSGNTNGLKAVM